MNSGSKIITAVLCSSEVSYESWINRANLYEGLTIQPMYPACQGWRIVKELIALYDEPILVCQDFVWFGSGFGGVVAQLIRDLNETFPQWGVCGNRGCAYDGATFDYTFMRRVFGIQTAIGSRHVLTLDDNLVLINCAMLASQELFDLCLVPSLVFGVPLSLECLRFELPLLVDPRLFAVRTGKHAASAVEKLVTSPEFQDYYSIHFVNHRLPWPDAAIDMQDYIDYEYVARPDQPPSQADVVTLFDNILNRSRKRPSLTLCCRTQFRRPELLYRAVTSFAIAQAEAKERLHLRVCLITECEPAVATPHIKRFSEQYPALDLQCWHQAIRPARYSRTDLLIAAIERATTEYIWFVDDDDYVLPGAIEALARVLNPGEPLVVTANSLKILETWTRGEFDGHSRQTLQDSRVKGRFEGYDVFGVLGGHNYIPICSMVLPLPVVAERLRRMRALGNYTEDYFVLLLALTSKQVEVRALNVNICGVSLREGENISGGVEHPEWHHSYATFMSEILLEEGRNPFLWQLAKNMIEWRKGPPCDRAVQSNWTLDAQAERMN